MAWIAILFTGASASPSILTLLVSGGDPATFDGDPGTSGFGAPHADMSNTAAATDHTFMRTGKH